MGLAVLLLAEIEAPHRKFDSQPLKIYAASFGSTYVPSAPLASVEADVADRWCDDRGRWR